MIDKHTLQLRYPFKILTWTTIFMRFGAISAINQRWSNQGSKDALLLTFQNWNLKVNLGTHFNKQMCTSTFMTFWAIFTPFNCNLTKSARRTFTFDKFLETKIWYPSIHFNLDTHLKYWHGHLYLWVLELFRPSLKDGQTKVEKMHFCWLS